MRGAHTAFVGVDEAGRGPLAGPVAVGAFAVGPNFDMNQLQGIRDSKTLSEKQREEWYKKLTALEGVHWTVAMSGNKIVDRIGIVPAVSHALCRALRSVTEPVKTQVLLDGGLRAPREYVHQKTIIHGDATEPLIAAAAILAKVTRDRYMVRQAKKFPEYGFQVHKGYGTKGHSEAIRLYGLSELHRVSFCTNLLEGKRQRSKVKPARKR